MSDSTHEGDDVPGDKVEEALRANEAICRKLLDLGPAMMAADSGHVFGVDLIAIAAIKRTVTVAAGFRALVRADNYLCSAALVRLQLDTLMRFTAIELVDDPHSLAGRILGGESLRKIKDRTGRPLVDVYLVDHLAKRLPWVTRVYKETSGFIHLSDKHMLSPVTGVDDEAKTVSMLVHETDFNVPPEHWRELVDCFNETTRVIGGAIASWAQRKSDVGEERRARNKPTQPVSEDRVPKSRSPPGPPTV